MPAVEELWTSARQTTVRLRAYAAEDPEAPAAVVVHGLVTSVDGLRSAVPDLDPYAGLAAEGLQVLALDLPGHGRSGGARGHLTYRLAMEAIAAAVDVARGRWGRPIGLAGTGLGGTLAFYAALEGEGIGAVACHTIMDLRDVRPVLQRTRQQVLLPIAGRVRRRLSEHSQQRISLPAAAVVAPADFAADPVLRRALWRHPQAVRRYDLAGLGTILLAPDDKPDVAAGRVPTLVAVGGEDRVLAPSTAHIVASRLTCPHEVWTLPGAAHQLILEHHRAAIPRLGGFLRDHLA